MNVGMRDHFWQKFAEIVLLTLTFFFVGMAYWATWANHQDFMSAMLDNNKLVLGALLGLLTKAMLSRSTDNNGGNDAKKTDNPSAPVPGAPSGLPQASQSAGAGSPQHL